MNEFLGINLLYWFYISLAIAFLYFRFWPRPKGKSKLTFVVLRYGHSAVWIFIALALFNHLYGESAMLADLFGYAAFVSYGLFLGMLLYDRWANKKKS